MLVELKNYFVYTFDTHPTVQDSYFLIFLLPAAHLAPLPALPPGPVLPSPLLLLQVQLPGGQPGPEAGGRMPLPPLLLIIVFRNGAEGWGHIAARPPSVDTRVISYFRDSTTVTRLWPICLNVTFGSSRICQTKPCPSSPSWQPEKQVTLSSPNLFIYQAKQSLAW